MMPLKVGGERTSATFSPRHQISRPSSRLSRYWSTVLIIAPSPYSTAWPASFLLHAAYVRARIGRQGCEQVLEQGRHLLYRLFATLLPCQGDDLGQLRAIAELEGGVGDKAVGQERNT